MPTVTPVQVVHLVVQEPRATQVVPVLMVSWETRVPMVTPVQVVHLAVQEPRATLEARVLMAL